MYTCVRTGTVDPQSPYSPGVCHPDSAPSAGPGTLPAVVAVNSQQQNLNQHSEHLIIAIRVLFP